VSASGGLNMASAVFEVPGFGTSASAARPQELYSINGEPASREDGAVMAGRGLPLGDYWVRNDGNWGFAGATDVQGNVYGRRPDLAERGLLYSRSEWLTARSSFKRAA
jgi:hypothetical protein